MWYQVYKDKVNPIFVDVKEKLDALMSVEMNPEYILKVTWDNMAPSVASEKTEVKSLSTLPTKTASKEVPIQFKYVHCFVWYKNN